jgi:hypothetical protein
MRQVVAMQVKVRGETAVCNVPIHAGSVGRDALPQKTLLLKGYDPSIWGIVFLGRGCLVLNADPA